VVGRKEAVKGDEARTDDEHAGSEEQGALREGVTGAGERNVQGKGV
jgi:hypothetical protein